MAASPGALTSRQAQELSAKGYALKFIKGLDFSSYRTLLQLSDIGPYGFENAAGQFRIYFQVKGPNGGERAIFTHTRDFAKIPSCRSLRGHAREVSERRAHLEKGLEFFKTKKNLGPALINTEIIYNRVLKNTGSEKEALASYALLLKNLRVEIPADYKAKDFFKTHDRLRPLIFGFGLSNYCSGQPSLTVFLQQRCANCSAQTKLILSLYHDLSLDPPPGWVFGAEVFHDHVRPVLVHYANKKIFDLVYNTVHEGLPNPIMSVEGLLRKTIETVERHNPILFVKADQFSSSIDLSYQFVPGRTWMDKAKEYLKIGKAERPLPQMDDIPTDTTNLSAEATVFDVPSENQFSDGPPPATADLSYALSRTSEDGFNNKPLKSDFEMERDPSRKPVDLRNPAFRIVNRSTHPFLSEATLAYVLPRERQLFERILRDQEYQIEDRKMLGYETIKNYPQNEKSAKTLLQPIKIQLAEKSAEHFKVFSAYSDYTDTSAPELVLHVFDPELAARLQKSSLTERYTWIFQQLIGESKEFAGVHLYTLEEFLSAPNPVEVWKVKRVDILRALQSFEQIFEGTQVLPDQMAPLFLVAVVPSYKSRWGNMAFARVALIQNFLKRHREILKSLDGLDERSLLGFFRFFESFDLMVNTSHFGYFEAQKNLQDKVGENAQDYWREPLSALLHRLLFDPEYLYTTKLTPAEKKKYAEYLRANGGEQASRVKIDLPQADWGLSCAGSEGKILNYGSVAVECPDLPKRSQIRRREEIQPMILAGLVSFSGPVVLRPNWAVLIHNAWREGHNEAVKRIQYTVGWQKPGDYPYVPSPEEMTGLFWSYLDGLLAKNLPTFSFPEIEPLVSKIFNRRGDSSSLDLARMYEDEFSRPGQAAVPVWVLDHPLYQEAYDFYLQFRPREKQVLLRLAPLTGTDAIDRVALLPGHFQYKWHISNSMYSYVDWNSVQIWKLGEGVVTPYIKIQIKEDGRTFILHMKRFGDEFYFAAPSFN